MEITKEQFEAYEAVRQSGATNMLDLPAVTTLSGLTKEEALEIIKNYGDLKDKFGAGL